MSKVAHYLQEHLSGEVTAEARMRKYFSTDGGVFELTPSLIVYPRNEGDVRKTARFTWQLAERGRVIPITARGMGTDQAGAAVGSGIMMVFPAHMKRILEFDGKTGDVVIEPGILYGKLQQALHTHGRFLPPYPSSIEFSTLGGAIANNAAGEKTVKYGCTRDFVKSLRVVLANGESIETRRLSKRELNKKMGLTTFEGEVYRALDALIEENKELLKDSKLKVSKNSAGYALADVKRKDGSFDLTPLLVGSQGTLGIVTEATIKTVPYNPETTLIAAYFDDLSVAEQALAEIRALPDQPSAMELVDEHLLNFLDKHNPNQLKGIVEKPFHKLVVLVEFDSANGRVQKKMAKRATKILNKLQVSFQVETDEKEKEKLWTIRHSAAAVISHSEGSTKALPIIEDGVVPVEKMQQYLHAVYDMFAKYKLDAAVWGHAGDANVHMQPFLDLSQIGDRQKVFKIIDEYYSMVISLGGSTSGEHSDGRLRAPYLKPLYGEGIYTVFQKLKLIFDPYGTLNPGVKIDVTLDDIKPLLRHEYSMDHLADHLPRT
ncbi:FAD-binding oxidoreductase [Candidatus Saccharibacteria bacterium]|nr:MAG: FAD-binding oxidoreductase [Candidatus Saccharibacteria bacterium]TXG77446.1 MAG: FAD-binding oxidoreductase [Patescibacteria group bacterium]